MFTFWLSKFWISRHVHIIIIINDIWRTKSVSRSKNQFFNCWMFCLKTKLCYFIIVWMNMEQGKQNQKHYYFRLHLFWKLMLLFWLVGTTIVWKLQQNKFIVRFLRFSCNEICNYFTQAGDPVFCLCLVIKVDRATWYYSPVGNTAYPKQLALHQHVLAWWGLLTQGFHVCNQPIYSNKRGLFRRTVLTVTVVVVPRCVWIVVCVCVCVSSSRGMRHKGAC